MDKMTDEEVVNKHLQSAIDRNESGAYNVLMRVVKESRKGMFTEDDMINFAQSECANYDNEDFMRERLTQYLTERKGR